MIEILLSIEQIVYFTLFALIIFYSLSDKRNISLLITLVTVFLSEILLKDSIEKLFPVFQSALSPVLYKVAVYSCFTASDLLASFGILKLHKIYHESLCFGAKQASLGLTGLAFLQIILFCLSFFVEREWFLTIYFISNASLGITILLMLIVCVAKDIVPFQISIKREKES
jgi:hypothetical protein